MSPEQHQQVRRVFAKVIELPEPERMPYLRATWSGDSEVLEEVARLLKAHNEVQSFLQTPPELTETETAQSKRIGRYVISGVLGRGSMGTVYSALDPRIGRTIALKTINVQGFSGGDDEFMRDRLLREARSAGALSHPGIVTIYD